MEFSVRPAQARRRLAPVLVRSLLAGSLLVLSGCGESGSDVEGPVAAAWGDLLFGIVRDARISPPVAARMMGYSGVAGYEAVRPAAPGLRSLAGQLNGLVSLPAPPAGGYDSDAAANAAIAGVLRGLFAGSPASLAAIDGLESRLADRSAAPRPVRDQSAAYGRELAGAILAWASADGYDRFARCRYEPSGRPGGWQPTPPAFGPPLEPCWGRLRPFVLADGRQCNAPPPPPYSTAPGSAFRAEADEVYEASRTLTPDQRRIARFWADNPGVTGTPPGHWLSIVGQLARRDGWPAPLVAEAYARVGIAVADAFISCWWTKYEFDLVRPVTYIRNVIDPSWTPIVATPPFPEYTSGHSVQSGAAALVLSDLLGPVAFVDRTHVGIGFEERIFPSFEAAAAEAAISRLYGGIHFRAAIDRGLDQGRCVGGRIVASVRFRE